MKRAASLLILTAAPLFAGRSALAAGYYVPDTGTVARSRGGAVVARGGDPLAIVYNPGALTEQRRPQLLLDMSALRFNAKFERSGVPGDAESGTTAKNDPPPQLVPAFVYTHPIGDRFTAAVGLVAPAGPRMKFDDDGPQRFSNTELTLQEATYGFALAVRAHPMFSVGFYGGALYTSVTHDFRATLNGEAPPSESPANDLPVRLDVKDPFTLTAGAGVKMHLSPELEMGFSYRPEANLDAGGTLVTREPSPAKEDVHFVFNVPAIWRGGIRYVQPSWDVEMDVFWEGWGSHDAEIVTADDGNFAGTSESSVARKFRDAWSVRLGSTVQAAKGVQVHGGAYVETSAVPERTMDVSTYDAPKAGLATGVSFDLSKSLVLSLNFTYTLLQPVEVKDSQQRQKSPFPEEIVPRDARSVVGNGTYSGNYEMAGLSLLAHF